MHFTAKIKLTALYTTAALVLAGSAMDGAVRAEPVSEPNTPGSVAATRPATTQVAPLDVTKLKFAGLLGDVRFRHAGTINSIAVVAGGKQLLTSGDDGTARLWDAATGQELCRVQYGEGQPRINQTVYCAALLPDGKRLLTGAGYELTLWDLETGKALRTMAHESTVLALAVSPDGKQAFTGDQRGPVIQWDAETGRKIRELAGHKESVHGVVVSPDGKTLITCGVDKSIRIWDAADARPLATMGNHTNQVMAVAFSPDGATFVSASRDLTVRLWDMAAVVQAQPGHATELWQARLPEAPERVVFSPDGQKLALSRNGFLWLLRSRDGQLLRTIELAEKSYWSGVSFSADSKDVLVNEGGVICWWDSATGQRIYPPPADGKFASGTMQELAVTPDGGRLYGGRRGGASLCVWDLPRRQLLDVWRMPEKFSITSVQPSLDGRRLLVGGEDVAAILDAKTGMPQIQFGRSSGNDPWFWGHDDRSVVTAAAEAPMKVFNVEGGRGYPLGTLRLAPELGGRSHVLATDGARRRVVSIEGSQMSIWSLTTEAKLGDLHAQGAMEILAAQWMPARPSASRAGDIAGAGLLTVGYQGQKYHLQYWGRRLAATPPEPSAAALARWVKSLAADDFDVRQEATSQLIAAGAAAPFRVVAALARADLNDAEVMDRLEQVRQGLEKYDVPDREFGRALTLDEPIPECALTALAAHPDGKHWALILDRGAASVVVLGEVTPDGPRELRRLSGEGHGPCSLLFSPDGKTLYVGNGNATISIYRAE